MSSAFILAHLEDPRPTALCHFRRWHSLPLRGAADPVELQHTKRPNPMPRFALYFLLSGLTVAVGVQVVDSAQQVAEQIKVRQIAQCETVNQVAPGTCQMPR